MEESQEKVENRHLPAIINMYNINEDRGSISAKREVIEWGAELAGQ